MASFGRTSLARLSTCHPLIGVILKKAILNYDFAIICGWRSKEEQNKAFSDGKSQVKWPNSNHNKEPFSLAVDVAPYPINWNDSARFYVLAGRIMQISNDMGIPVIWGGDWDGDDDLLDQKFNDLGHFELI